MGFSPLLIAERLGHEKVQTTMDTYSHLYPNKQVEVARQLDGIMPGASGYKNRCKCSQFVATKKRKILKSAVLPTLFRIQKTLNIYSHSIVAGGLEVISYTTRLMLPTSLTSRTEMRSSTS